MTDRYSRQILFNPIGDIGQKKIRSKHVVIVGCGALGSVNAENLVRAGIGKLTLIDRDYVELTNLQRQQLYTEKDVSKNIPKAIAAKTRLAAINSEVEIHAHVLDATYQTLEPFVQSADLLLDSTDNFDTRLMINDLLHKYQKPWIFGSCVGSTGMSFTIIPGETPCLHCLLSTTSISGATCDSVGIIAPAVQMVVAHQTTEALKILVDDRDALRTKLVTFDLWNNLYQQIEVKRAKKATCPTCGINPSFPFLQYEMQTKTEVLCGRNTVQIRAKKPIHIEELAERLKAVGPVQINPYLLSVQYKSYRIVFFKDGRALIHGTDSIEIAKSIYYQIAG